MPLAHLFEDFSASNSVASEQRELSSEAIEDEKLKSFEDGYGAGWEDAFKTQAENGKALSITVQKSLEESEFTKDAALEAFISAAIPLFEGMISQVLPFLADRTFPEHILAVVEDSLKKSIDLPLEIRVSPDQLTPVSSVIKEGLPASVSLQVDQDLAPGQATIAFGESEQQIDLAGLLSEVSQAVDTFKFSIQQETGDV